MKNTLLKSICFCLIALQSCKTKSQIDRPEKIGKQVFSILKKIQITTIDEYYSNFISIEELKNLFNNSEASEESKNEIALLTKEEHYSEVYKFYSTIKKEGVDKEIDFSKIIYSDFTYEIIEVEGIKNCVGILYFKNNERTYKIKSESLYTGKKYALIDIRRLEKK